MKRRSFIGCALSIGPAMSVLNPFSTQASSGKPETIADVIVAGGTLAGCLAAIEAACKGRRVILIESSSCLGGDITASLRPWIDSEDLEKLDPEAVTLLFGDSLINNRSHNQDSIVELGALKKNLVECLLETNVDILFLSQPAGVLMDNDKVCGLVIGNKGGLQAIPARTIIDATNDGLLMRLSGLNLPLNRRDLTAARTLEFFNITDSEKPYIDVSSELGLIDNRILLHPGSKSKDHVYVEFHFPVTCERADYRERNQWEMEAREKTIRLCGYLKSQTAAFSKAILLQASPALHTQALYDIDTILKQQGQVQGRPNLYALKQDNLGESIRNARIIAKAATERAIDTSLSFQPQTSHIQWNKTKTQLNDLSPRLHHDHRFDLFFYNLNIPSIKVLPEKDTCDILIVGGGTSGASSAIAASRMKQDIILIEPFSGLGGTGTLGGINTYYHGYDGGFSTELDQLTLEMTNRINDHAPSRQWNIEAKMMTYLSEIQKNKGRVWLRSKAVGAIIENNQFQGVIVLNTDGLGVVRAPVTIDATGDGDLAAWSGVKCVLGDTQTGDLQTFNQCDWQWNKKLVGVNLDLGVMDVSDPTDTTRGVLMGHCNGSRYDFSPFPCVRESRHIEGDYQFCEEDVFLQRRFPDTIAIGKTDYDQHGLQGSRFARMGYLPYHRDEKIIRLPYRACLPKGVDGLLVTGKAFSSTRDAFCFMRMQRDLQNMGYAVGLAAAQAVERKCAPREIDVQSLQKLLLEKGIIREEDIASTVDEYPIHDSIRSLLAGEESALLPVLCYPKDTILPQLEKQYPNTTGKGRMLTAMAMAWFGSNRGVDTLLETLDELKNKPQQSGIDSSKRPNGGFVGEPNTYWRVNQLIVSLGLAGDQRAIDLLNQITNQTDAGGPIRPHNRLHWRRIPNYDRILSLCFSYKHLADSRAIPALESLLNKSYISGYTAKEGLDGGQNYSSALLELIIAETLTHLGSRKGSLVLADYIEDVRAILSNRAYAVLKEIYNKGFGRNSESWKTWLFKK